MLALLARKERKRARRAARARIEFVGREGAIRLMVELIRADWLDGHTPTLLNHEGALVAAVRAMLCLRSLPWAVADAEARDAVSEALRKAGGKRPSWQEGQPEFTEAGVIRETRVSCANCGKPLDVGQKLYCSRTCGDAARHRRYWQDLSDAERLRLNLIRKRRHHAAQS